MSLSDKELEARVDAFNEHGSAEASRQLGIDPATLRYSLKCAAERGMMLDHPPAMPGYRISQINDGPHGTSIQQRPEHGEVFEMPPGLRLKGVTALVDAEGRIMHKHVMAREGAAEQLAAMEAVISALTSELPRADPIAVPVGGNADLLNQYTVTDLHFGMLSWHEETGSDYDLKIAEQLLLDWFAMAIKMSPDADTAILAQLGDLLHFDSLESVTPTHRNVLDADSRYAKIVRVVIRTMRRIIKMLLEKYQRVHIIMADANHDPAGEIWLREMFSAFYESEPRITVDRSASTYYVFEHGETSLFYHHGHLKKIGDVDSVFAGKFRETYGRTKFSYAHIGHHHSNELKSTNLMKVERHETLAAPDAFAAQRGYLAGRSAKVLTYSKRFGEVGHIIITPEMVASNDASTDAGDPGRCL